MGEGMEKRIFYFDKKGPVNTEKTLEIAMVCCNERNINKIVVASSTGDTALKLRALRDALDFIDLNKQNLYAILFMITGISENFSS